MAAAILRTQEDPCRMLEAGGLVPVRSGMSLSKLTETLAPEVVDLDGLRSDV